MTTITAQEALQRTIEFDALPDDEHGLEPLSQQVLPPLTSVIQ